MKETFLARRVRQHEWMDAPDVAPADLERSLRFIRRTNRLLRYTRATLSHLQRFSRSWKPGQKIRILDVGTGSADVPLAILEWAHKRQFDVRITGIDLHAATARVAASRADDSKLKIVRADAMQMPFETGSFDYALNSMFLHHLDEGQVVRVLKEMDRVARRGLIIADLLRSISAYRWIQLFTAFSIPIIKHDARASVIQAFNREEILALRDRAGVSYLKYHRHIAYRFVLAAEKPGSGTL